jgi:hypothetical protein
MALEQVGYHAPGAVLYTSLAPSRLVFYTTQLPLLMNSQISSLVYGYCEVSSSITKDVLQQIEKAGIRLVYLRIPEVLYFYAPYRFAEVYAPAAPDA